MTSPANYIVPPVQPIQQPRINVPGNGQQPGMQGQQQPQKGAGDESTLHHLMILIGALAEALVSAGVLTEEDIHNAIARLEIGEEAPEEEEEEEDEESEVNRSQPNPKASGSPGYPGAADTEKGMGNEWGKNQR